uniref:natriuretic peptides A n=1 Tax=Semicossyphus pulcher TaxID=241346 RepID=UPI0037E9ADA7
MRIAVLWGLLLLLVQHTLVSSHVLGRPSSTSDLAQLKSLLQRFEETLAEAAQGEEDSEADYEARNQETEHSQTGRGWSPEQEVDQEALVPDRSQSAAEGRSRAEANQRSRLHDLLLTARKRASGCFGARMDRIGNASGLGCNNGRG